MPHNNSKNKFQPIKTFKNDECLIESDREFVDLLDKKLTRIIFSSFLYLEKFLPYFSGIFFTKKVTKKVGYWLGKILLHYFDSVKKFLGYVHYQKFGYCQKV